MLVSQLCRILLFTA